MKTKREMIEEIIDGLEFPDNEKVIQNRIKQPFNKIKEVYDFYLKSEKSRKDKMFCINVLIWWQK